MIPPDPYRHAPHDAESAREMRRVLVEHFERTQRMRWPSWYFYASFWLVVIGVFGWVTLLGYEILVRRVERASREVSGELATAQPDPICRAGDSRMSIVDKVVCWSGDRIRCGHLDAGTP